MKTRIWTFTVIAIIMVFLFLVVENEVLEKLFLCVAVVSPLVGLWCQFASRPSDVIREIDKQANPDGDAGPAAATIPTVGDTTPPGSGDVIDNKLVDKFLKNCKFGGLECLYALMVRENREPLSSKEIIKYMGEGFYGFFYGFVVAARSIELVKFTAGRRRWAVTWIHPRIKDTLKSAIGDRLGPKRTPVFKKLHDMLGIEWKDADWQ